MYVATHVVYLHAALLFPYPIPISNTNASVQRNINFFFISYSHSHLTFTSQHSKHPPKFRNTLDKMAPVRATRKRQSTSSVEDQKIPTTKGTPQRSPIKKRRMGLSLAQKQALVDNLQLESMDARTLEKFRGIALMDGSHRTCQTIKSSV